MISNKMTITVIENSFIEASDLQLATQSISF